MGGHYSSVKYGSSYWSSDFLSSKLLKQPNGGLLAGKSNPLEERRRAEFEDKLRGKLSLFEKPAE